MSLRPVLALRYLSSILVPLVLFLAFTRPQMERDKKAGDALAREGAHLLEASARLVRALPPPRPPVAWRLDTVASLAVEGLEVRELSRTLAGSPSVRLALRGGYRELVCFLDEAWCLPFAGRASSLVLCPSPEGEGLEGEAVIEVEP